MMLTVKEVSKKTGWSEAKVRQLINAGKLPAATHRLEMGKKCLFLLGMLRNSGFRD